MKGANTFAIKYRKSVSFVRVSGHGPPERIVIRMSPKMCFVCFTYILERLVRLFIRFDRNSDIPLEIDREQ